MALLALTSACVLAATDARPASAAALPALAVGATVGSRMLRWERRDGRHLHGALATAVVLLLTAGIWLVGGGVAGAEGERPGARPRQARVDAEERRRILKTTRRLISRAGRRCSS